VLLYIKDIFVFKELPVDYYNLEILPIEIRFLNISFCITVFFCPPSFIFDALCNFLASLHIYRFSHFVLIGDFNVDMSNPDHPLYSNVCNIMEVFSFTQVVTKCTHSSPSCNSSLIDLANGLKLAKPLHSTCILKGKLFSNMPMQTLQRPIN